jgi:hypothetical protein
MDQGEHKRNWRFERNCRDFRFCWDKRNFWICRNCRDFRQFWYCWRARPTGGDWTARFNRASRSPRPTRPDWTPGDPRSERNFRKLWICGN